MIEKVFFKQTLLSIIIRSNFCGEGIEFFTPETFSQQVGYMKRPQNYVIPPHTHNKISRDVCLTQEVLFMKQGCARVDFYDTDQNYMESTIIRTGDVILLAAGGHGLQMLEESEIIEVKQGPYLGENDKVQFEPVARTHIKIKAS